jgi:hypothetical protein
MGLDLPKVTQADLHRFEGTARIKDPVAFAAALDAFIQEKVGSANELVAEDDSLTQRLSAKARALRADVRWTPTPTAIQRGRQVLLAVFDSPQNLPLPEFARLAHKSRQQIYKDLAAKPPRLLALSVGPRRQRLPDWQLDPLRLRLTQEVLEASDEVDAWTVYHALSEPLDGLRGRSPVEAVSAANLPQVVKAVRGVLGLH